MLHILNCNPSKLSFEKIKKYLKILFQKTDGPQSLLFNLKNSLSKNNFPYVVNHVIKAGDVVHVISGIGALKYAINEKKIGTIDKLIVGPNISISPVDSNFILSDSNIDKVLVPSDWVKKFYISECPEIADKIRVWPAGVSDNGEKTDKTGGWIIYYKKAPAELFESIKSKLSSRGQDYSVIKYGKYKQNDYFNLLKTAKGAIFLSESESQGLALQEAWIRDVPTLVWNRGYWKSGKRVWYDDKISAPYLSFESGLFFKGAEDFDQKMNIFCETDFKPREYCLKNLTDEVSTKILLNIIKEDEKNY